MVLLTEDGQNKHMDTSRIQFAGVRLEYHLHPVASLLHQLGLDPPTRFVITRLKLGFHIIVPELGLLSTLPCSKITFFIFISQSLEDVDDCEGVLPKGESSKARKTPDAEVDVAPDGDEDEGIEEEEEEEYFGMVF